MRTKVMAAVAAAALIPLSACGAGESGGGGGGGSESNYPSEPLDWTIAFGPGGGNDIMARTIVDILQKDDLYPENIEVQNREGGSGATGWGYLFSQSGSGYGISTTSGSFITTPLQADTGWEPTDFTPVGLFATDDAVFLVNGDSPHKDWESWVEAAKSERMVIGGIGTVNVDFIVAQMLSDQAGFEFEYVPFNEEGQLMTALTSGAVNAIVSNPGEILGQVLLSWHNIAFFGALTTAMREAIADGRFEAFRRDFADRQLRGARRPDRPGARLRGHPVDAPRHDPASGRARGGAGVVDRDDGEGRRDRGVEGLHRGEPPHRGHPLG